MKYNFNKLTDTYLENHKYHKKAFMIREYIKTDPEAAWLIIREIIRRVSKNAEPYNEICFEFELLLQNFGDEVLSDLENEGSYNDLLLKCFERIFSLSAAYTDNPQIPPVIINRIKILHENFSKNMFKEKVFKERPLSAKQLEILNAWCKYSETFWAWEEVDDIVRKSPKNALKLIIELLEKAKNDKKIIAYIAAGPLEDLLTRHGMAIIDQVTTRARENHNLKIALSGIWLDEEEDEVYPHWKSLMKEFGYWDLKDKHPLD